MVALFTTKSIHPDDPPDDHGSDRCPARGVYERHLPYGKSRVCRTPTIRENDSVCVMHTHTRAHTHALTRTQNTHTHTYTHHLISSLLHFESVGIVTIV